jgi:hypothetical protein
MKRPTGARVPGDAPYRATLRRKCIDLLLLRASHAPMVIRRPRRRRNAPGPGAEGISFGAGVTIGARRLSRTLDLVGTG